jgi:hypothetical protein
MPRALRLAVIVTAAALTTIGLTGCTDAAERPAASASPSTEAPVIDEPAAEVETIPEVEPVATPTTRPCMGLPYTPAVTKDAVERIGGFGIPKLGDRGSIPGATGTVTLGADGQPVSYVVAAGDTYTGLTERFCLTPMDPYIEMVNSVRRNSGFSGDNMPPFALYAGDVINLDAHTVTSVGTENGRVLALTPTIYLPPQR